MVEKDGVKLGVRTPKFEYTEKTIIAQRNWEKKTCPPVIDHRSAPHPYTCRWPPVSNLPPGEKQEWFKQIAKSVIYNKNDSINEMIDHIYLETEKAFKGTTHENYWTAYHDALSFFVAK